MKEETGGATVIVVVLIASLLAITAAMTAGAFQLGIGSHTSAVADLAALAAAESGSCEAAQQVVDRNPGHGLELLRCEIDAGFAQVLVRSGQIRSEQTSRAGPTW